MQDLIRIISQPEKAPKDQEQSVLAADSDDDDEEEDDTEEEEDAEEASPEPSDEKAEPEAEMERPAAMEVDNGQPTTSDQVMCGPHALCHQH